MTILESLKVSAFGLSIVFAVLILLSLLVEIQSSIAAFIGKNLNATRVSESITAECVGSAEQNNVGASSGELRLTGVDEKTAAMIMAIISHESKIPLSELKFNSIKTVGGQITT